MTVSDSGVLERLRTETRDEHLALERKLAMLEQPLTPARYLQILKAFYGFYQPWEAGLVPWTISFYGAEARHREKCGLLAKDLLHFGVSPASLSLYEGLPRVENIAQAIGSMYVMEGATLGGQIIQRQVRREMRLHLDGCRFFTGYGEDTGAMWRQFKQLATERTVTASEDEVIVSAAATFRNFHEWLNQANL